MKQTNGIWNKPLKASFSSNHYDGDFSLSPNGKMLYLASDRPLEKGKPKPENSSIWVIRKTDSGWSGPRLLEYPVNSGQHDSYPSVTTDGTLYFFSRRNGGFGSSDIYRSKLNKGKYTHVENLGTTINTEYNEVDPFIAPDESYMIFCTNKPGGYGEEDLYISFLKKENSSWTKPVNMGKEINSSKADWMPYVTPDGKYFFFTSNKMMKLSPDIQKSITDLPGNGSRDIYWVDAKIIEELKPHNLK